MKRILALLVVATVATFGLSAQADNLRTKGGDMSLLFTLNGLQNLGAGNYMGGVGIGYYLSNGLQLRGGIGFGSNSETTGTGDAEAKTSSSTFTIAPAIRYNLMQSSTVVGYTGLQVGFTSTSGSTTVGGNETGSSSGSTIGAGVILGGEWFPWSNVSLGLEYGLGFSTTSSKSKNAQGTESDGPTTTAINLGLSTVQFTLALYLN